MHTLSSAQRVRSLRASYAQGILTLVLLLLPLGGPLQAYAESSANSGSTAAMAGDSKAVRPAMHEAYAAFRDLQKFIVSRQRFQDPANAAEISALMGTLKNSFHKVEGTPTKLSSEPGFASTLKVLNEMLGDAKQRFDEGKSGYALWRLKSASSHCVSCHTRHEVPMEFSDDSVRLGLLSPIERGEFFLATRQFQRAKETFKQAVLDPEGEPIRMSALRNWLLVFTRVQPNPNAALTELTHMLAKTTMRSYDREEIQSWIVSLRRWKGEGKKFDIPVLKRAENLIRQAVGGGDPISARIGTVELLRATAMLHTLLEGNEVLGEGDRGYALYLLGLCYSELPSFFVVELPEMFLEQSVREVPSSETAQKAFAKYREVVTLGFTGSGGTRIPDDVLLKFKELHDIAYGTPALKERV